VGSGEGPYESVCPEQALVCLSCSFRRRSKERSSCEQGSCERCRLEAFCVEEALAEASSSRGREADRSLRASVPLNSRSCEAVREHLKGAVLLGSEVSP
jgi:hypothetical protein